LKNCFGAAVVLGSIFLPILTLIVQVAAMSAAVVYRGIARVGPVVLALSPGCLLQVSLGTSLYLLVLAAHWLMVFATLFVLLLENVPPDDQSVTHFLVFIAPLFASAMCPLVVSYVCGAPLTGEWRECPFLNLS
jgi:hypothetical protein